jgi:hypothetical protein
MRANTLALLASLILLAAASPAARAQTAYPGDDTDAGARPGNIIGTGNSLPRSNAASNLNAATTHSDLAPNLPAPPGDDGMRQLLADARQDLLANQTGAAQEALERAETRALDRSIPAGTERVPDQSPLVRATARARAALASGNPALAIHIITGALHEP